MPDVQLRSDDGGRIVTIPVPEPDQMRAVLAVAFTKSGSVMLDGILQELCSVGHRSYVRVETELFTLGLQVRKFDSAIACMIHESGYVYGVFRTALNGFFSETVDNLVRLFLIRDPRDAIVSYYFSMKNSHALPARGDIRESLVQQRTDLESIDLEDAILSNRFGYFFDEIERIALLSQRSGAIIYRYEDIVFLKEKWIRDLAIRICVELNENTLRKLLKRFDIVPSREDVNNHVRQVTPGDYRRKLSPKAIAHLEQRYSKLFEQLGYVTEFA
jgi:hypothetical protein